METGHLKCHWVQLLEGQICLMFWLPWTFCSAAPEGGKAIWQLVVMNMTGNSAPPQEWASPHPQGMELTYVAKHGGMGTTSEIYLFTGLLEL